MFIGIGLMVLQLLFPEAGVVLKSGLLGVGIVVLLAGASRRRLTSIEVTLSFGVLIFAIVAKTVSSNRVFTLSVEVAASVCLIVLAAIVVFKQRGHFWEGIPLR